ncbi:MAG TPA: DUF6690 family protein [Pirellulaceae bacterium]|jgi:hypothetical protein|nr:DUF6690 family protein [Pirellulaceae bacterium]
MSDGKRLWIIPALASALGAPFVMFDEGTMQTVRERMAGLSSDSISVPSADGSGGYARVRLSESRPWPTDVAGQLQQRRIASTAALSGDLAGSTNPFQAQTYGGIDPSSTGSLVSSSGGPGMNAAYVTPMRPGDGPMPFDQIVRFDLTPDLITQNWSRVTTTQSEHFLLGMRVAVVTGPEISDLAGSMTYYFDDQDQLQRISLQGFTGDASRLIAHCEQGYKLEKQASLDAGMYVSLWNGMPTSVLHVARAPVIRADSPRTQYYVTLEINRPSAHMQLSPQASALLEKTHQAKRWSL